MIEILSGAALLCMIGIALLWRAYFGDDDQRSSSTDDITDGIFGGGDSDGGD